MRRAILILWAAAAAMSACVQPVVAQVTQPPTGTTLYRVVDIDPQDAFGKGLKPWGTNTNLLEHLQGSSCAKGNRSSAFIATTSSRDWAERYAIRRARRNGRTALLTIAPNDTYFGVENTLQAIDPDRVPEILTLGAAVQQEWIAANGIPGEQIQSADVYTSNGTADPVVTVFSNPGFIRPSTQPTNAPWPGGLGNSFSERMIALVVGIFPRAGACFSGAESDVILPRGGPGGEL